MAYEMLTLLERVALNQGDELCLNWYCHYCEAPLQRPEDYKALEPDDDSYGRTHWLHHDGRRFYLGRVPATIDHLVPRSQGGTDDEANLVLCCRSCNSMKGDRPLWQFEAIQKEWLWRNRHFMHLMRLEWAKYYYTRPSDRENRAMHEETRRLFGWRPRS